MYLTKINVLLLLRSLEEGCWLVQVQRQAGSVLRCAGLTVSSAVVTEATAASAAITQAVRSIICVRSEAKSAQYFGAGSKEKYNFK